MALFIMLYKVVLTSRVCGLNANGATIRIKATEQYFPVVLFIMLFKLILTFVSVDEFVKWNNLSESC